MQFLSDMKSCILVVSLVAGKKTSSLSRETTLTQIGLSKVPFCSGSIRLRHALLSTATVKGGLQADPWTVKNNQCWLS